MNIYLLVKTIHIVTATILFGTGLGIAFFMFWGRFDESPPARFYAVRTTVLADTVFTAPAAVLQPMTGAWLIWNGGFRWDEPWLLVAYGLYALAAICWLAVVWIQIRLKQMLSESLTTGEPLSPAYTPLLRVWFFLGWPAFLGLLVIFYLMVAEPA
jgi:uncharacterized membrane protein